MKIEETNYEGVEFDALCHLMTNRKELDDFNERGWSVERDDEVKFFKDENGDIYTGLVYFDNDGDEKDYDYEFLCSDETFKKEVELHNEVNNQTQHND